MNRPDSINFLIDPGTASAEELAELFIEISKLSKMMTGVGLKFEVCEARTNPPADEEKKPRTLL